MSLENTTNGKNRSQELLVSKCVFVYKEFGNRIAYKFGDVIVHTFLDQEKKVDRKLKVNGVYIVETVFATNKTKLTMSKTILEDLKIEI